MSARKLFVAGYRDLVSVVPPDATIAPTSTLKPEARGKVPGKRRYDGLWVGYPFTKDDPPSPQDIAEWEAWGANFGLRADRFPGLDIDVEHPQLAQLVVQEAHRLLGTAPVRTSRSCRKLLVYRADEPFSRIACTITLAGKEHTVEMLGEGRQYLVHGQHPSGIPYGWEGRPLWDWPVDDLETVTAEDVLAFFCALAQKLEGRATVEIHGTGERKADTAPPQDHLLAQGDLAALVASIPNTYPDRDTYIEFGHAIKAAGGEEAFEVFAEWASRWEGGTNDPETVAADWSRMHPPFRVGWGWLVEKAQAAGYNPAQDVFEADVDVVVPEVVESDGVLDFTDTWVVEQLAGMLAGNLKYVPETGHWHVWG